MTLHHNDSSHIRKTYILSNISIHKQGGVDQLLVVDLDAKQSALDRWKCIATHWIDGAPHPGTLHLLDAEKEVRKKNWDF